MSLHRFPCSAAFWNRFRILAPLLAGMVFLVLLAALSGLRLKLDGVGLLSFITDAMFAPPVQRMMRQFVLTLLLPSYVLASLVYWVLTWGWGVLWIPGWRRQWTAKEAFLLTISAMLFGHLVLWWRVPSTLWVFPGLRSIPFFLLFPLILALCLVYPTLMILRRGAEGVTRRGLLIGGWLTLWVIPVLLPLYLPRFHVQARGGVDACQVLFLGVDGLRADTMLPRTEGFTGQRYPYAYTPIPATRLLWSLLWGGDPGLFTVGHVAISAEELQNKDVLPLIRLASSMGYKPRFYIDDGGTIGLSGRDVGFDDVLMPAKGLENFVNSNLAASFPLYAAWENWYKPFPTTNPWTTMDGGLKEALRLGRGSKWVMFHSCLAHQPIFLNRGELAQLGRWWTLPPQWLQPMVTLDQVTQKAHDRYDSRMSPFRAYEIRMGSILDSWQTVWNGLEQDPQYKTARRILFSDHGERFTHATEKVQLQGIHGFDLSPWEVRAAFLVGGPGFPKEAGAPASDANISLLVMRNEMLRLLNGSKDAFSRQAIERDYPIAPMRYHTISPEVGNEESEQYKNMKVKDIVKMSGIMEDGTWVMSYSRSAEERASEVSIGFGEKETLHFLKPLLSGGAHQFNYRNYSLESVEFIEESEFRNKKEKIMTLLNKGGHLSAN